jgi:hypothetical protein
VWKDGGTRYPGLVYFFLNKSAKNDIIKWVAGMLIAQAALITTLVKLL